MENHKELALFDLDGTITRKDTFLDFVKYVSGGWAFFAGGLRLMPWIAGYYAGRVPNNRLKEMVLERFYGGMPEDAFRRAAEAYSRERLPLLVRPMALERIHWHREAGHRVVVVSASVEFWIQPWCREHGLELIATRLQVQDGRITGRLATANCYGPEKVRRIREVLDPGQYRRIHAYGDSRGDREMLDMAHEPHFRPFRKEHPS